MNAWLIAGNLNSAYQKFSPSVFKDLSLFTKAINTEIISFRFANDLIEIQGDRNKFSTWIFEVSSSP